jgi:hypothetical protein
MKPSYLTHSPIAWISLLLIVGGLAWKWVVTATGLPLWMMPIGYFVALIASGMLFVGWVRWRAKHPAARP